MHHQLLKAFQDSAIHEVELIIRLNLMNLNWKGDELRTKIVNSDDTIKNVLELIDETFAYFCPRKSALENEIVICDLRGTTWHWCRKVKGKKEKPEKNIQQTKQQNNYGSRQECRLAMEANFLLTRAALFTMNKLTKSVSSNQNKIYLTYINDIKDPKIHQKLTQTHMTSRANIKLRRWIMHEKVLDKECKHSLEHLNTKEKQVREKQRELKTIQQTVLLRESRY
ncbi:CLUMA_CG016639, isoform A [Clunio marinus]|uniref:CLUMA_CG016639, isoform A n=1 Tax=Clunio marinus TaxID=568069 RepID=A0A1J1IVN3_9DIPT|nr:CLUMA_CG016639, isoform A [Clunio marinus]